MIYDYQKSDIIPGEKICIELCDVRVVFFSSGDSFGWLDSRQDKIVRDFTTVRVFDPEIGNFPRRPGRFRRNFFNCAGETIRWITNIFFYCHLFVCSHCPGRLRPHERSKRGFADAGSRRRIFQSGKRGEVGGPSEETCTGKGSDAAPPRSGKTNQKISPFFPERIFRANPEFSFREFPGRWRGSRR